jgi:hypothetical protein
MKLRIVGRAARLYLEVAMSGTGLSSKRRVGRPRRYVATYEIRELRMQGLSFRQIAWITGLSYGAVHRAYLSSALEDSTRSKTQQA